MTLPVSLLFAKRSYQRARFVLRFHSSQRLASLEIAAADEIVAFVAVLFLLP
jgi:hypothetical protein